MSGLNSYRDTGPEDYLATGEKDRRATKAGNTANNNIAIGGYLPADSTVTVTTLAEVDPDTHEATTSATVTTLATRTTNTTFNFTNAAESSGNLRWSFGCFTNSSGGFT